MWKGNEIMGKLEAKQNKEEMKVTTFEDLKRYAEGTSVQLPAFSESCPFVAVLKSPCVVRLAMSGKIPNQLMKVAVELFSSEDAGDKKSAEETLKEMNDVREVMEIVADAAMVSPTFAEVKEAGLELSDAQLLAIYNFTQTGVEDLRFFRTK